MNMQRVALIRKLRSIQYLEIIFALLIVAVTVWGYGDPFRRPFGWRLANLLAHLVNTLLVCVLTKRLLKSSYASLVVGGLFGLHAGHTEAVTQISARADVVCTTFFLLSIFFFISARMVEGRFALAESRHLTRTTILSLICFTCALVVNEMAMTLPLIVIGYDLIFCTQWARFRYVVREKITLYFPYVLILLIYGVIRFWVFSIGEMESFAGVGLFTCGKMISSFQALATPFAEHIFSSSVLINLFGIAVVSLICLILSKDTRFAILWIMITLLPVSAVNIGRGTYLASVGFCLLLGIIVAGNIPSTYRIVQIVVIVALVARYGIALKESNVHWGQIAVINQKVPLMVKAMYPTFPDQATVCLQNVPLVPEQQFTNAVEFQYPTSRLKGIYVEDFEQCAARETQDSLGNVYFFDYDHGTLYDMTYETREYIASQQTISIQNVSQLPQHVVSAEKSQLHVDLDVIEPCVAIGIVSALANGIDVPQGTIIARGRIEGENGATETFEIVAGVDTAEWAIRFPQIQKIVHHTPPQAYRSWTVQQSDQSIVVAQNYMKPISLQPSFMPTKLSLQLVTVPGLPSNLSLDVNRIVFYPVQGSDR
jgi:hypothetical protein